MRHFLTIFFSFLLMAAGCSVHEEGTGNSGTDSGYGDLVPQDVVLHREFTEDFSTDVPEQIEFAYRTVREDFRYFPGVPSYTERNTDILMLRIDPFDQAGAERGSVVLSKDYTFYGTYSTRIRVPDIRRAQPNVSALADFSVSYEDPSYGYNEIFIECRIADPRILYLGTKTGIAPEQNTLSKIVNLADGTVYDASYSSVTVLNNGSSSANFGGELSGAQNLPETFNALDGFDASSCFHVCGFDWYPDKIIWWIQDPDTEEKTILWEYEGADLFPGRPSSTGIPVIPSKCRLAFWHSKISPVEGNSASVEAPFYPYELEVDRISYEPFDDLNNAWQEEHFNR